MNVYESFGTFDVTTGKFNLAVQTTILELDEYYIMKYYDISNANRYAIVANLQTKLKNENDLSMYKPNSAYMDTKIALSSVDKSYRVARDRDINNVTNGDVIDVYVHHAIGFDPKTNAADEEVIKIYKSGGEPLIPGGSKPGVGGRGILK